MNLFLREKRLFAAIVSVRTEDFESLYASLESFLHYRNIDVSSIKELSKRWRPDLQDLIKKKGSHSALLDIRESIEELKVYRDHFFVLR